MAAVGLLAMLPHIASFLFLNIGGYFADYLTNKGIKLIVVKALQFNSFWWEWYMSMYRSRTQ